MMNNKRQYGLSLVEIMVALALSAVLTTALYRIVIANQQGMMVTEAYAKTQDAVRTAYDMLQYDIRMAGYRGCAHSSVNVHNGLDATSGGYNSALHNFTNTIELLATYTSPDGVASDTGSDVFISRAAVPTDLLVASTTLNNIGVMGPEAQFEQLSAGHVMMVSDCKDADIFSISSVQDQTPALINHLQSVSGGPSNAANNLSKQYPAGSQVLLMNPVIYFIAESRLIPDAGINSLYRYEMLNPAGESRELVPYVNSMSIEFFMDTDGNGEPDTYLDRSGMSAFATSNPAVSLTDRIYAARVVLQIATEQSCALAGANSDRCLNPQTYQRVIYVRNSGNRSA